MHLNSFPFTGIPIRITSYHQFHSFRNTLQYNSHVKSLCEHGTVATDYDTHLQSFWSTFIKNTKALVAKALVGIICIRTFKVFLIGGREDDNKQLRKTERFDVNCEAPFQWSPRQDQSF